jgi:hypothetical protein
MSLTLRNGLLTGAEHGELTANHTLSDCPLDICSQGETDRGLQLFHFPLPEGPILKKITYTTLYQPRCQRGSLRHFSDNRSLNRLSEPDYHRSIEVAFLSRDCGRQPRE